jgi:hypothetical protein
LLSDRLVWIGAKGGDVHHRHPLPVALGQESCGFRSAAVQALTKAAIEWRVICQVSSLEPTAWSAPSRVSARFPSPLENGVHDDHAAN